MNVKKVVVGNLETNTYILEKNGNCLIIDPGDEFNKIKKSINKNVVGILLTHRHFDHIGALNDCINFYNVNVYDKSNLKEGKNIISNFTFNVIFNPGHTFDSISFIFDEVMFSGDFVFYGTIGRWDLGGDMNLMKDSISMILKSNINYKIYPGHGETTYLDNEREMLEYYLK